MDTDKKYDVKLTAKILPFRCPNCRGFGTLNYGKIKCHSCKGKGILLIKQEEIYENKDNSY